MTLSYKQRVHQSYADLLEDNMELRQEQRRLERHIDAIESELRIYRNIARQHPELFGRKVERGNGGAA